MKTRVRGILVTPDNGVLTIKRVRPATAPYWVLPGGGVENGDASLEAALLREVREELGGEAHIHSLIHVVDGAEERQLFFLATIESWDLAERTGPEFTDPSRGEYHVQEVPLTAAGIASIDLKPEQVAELLAEHESGVFDLVDLRPEWLASAR
ncbi:NUDIX domain-containing protein [Nonomuraea purpurea]|uniref:NUDIX domain-containing protein n=1 Tax=Nonomuraea purpurea TaxID=1849276 RepID=A0ABV8GI49_9ACTN